MQELADILAKCCSWTLSVNDHRMTYESVQEYFANHATTGCSQPDAETVLACVASGAIYELQVYERTPVSFVLVWAPSFAALLESVRDYEWQSISPVMSRSM